MTERDGGTESQGARRSGTGSTEGVKKPRIDWADPTVPVGNAPPLPWWPLVVSGALWLAWVVFLVAMALSSAEASPG